MPATLKNLYPTGFAMSPASLLVSLFILTFFASPFNLQAQESIKVNFKIDASSLKNIKSFGVRGNTLPLSWEETLEFTDPDNDGIYEGEVTFNTTEKMVEYKFVYGDKKVVYELEGQNRILLLDGEDVSLDLTWNIPNEIDIAKLPDIPASAIQEDFKILKKALLEIHPGLLRYRSQHILPIHVLPGSLPEFNETDFVYTMRTYFSEFLQSKRVH